MMNELQSIDAVFIPESYGYVQKKWTAPVGSSNAYVIYVQNTYTTIESQNNISKMVELLVKVNGIDYVITDAMEGLFDTTVYESTSQKKIIQKFYEDLLQKGLLSSQEKDVIDRMSEYPFSVDHIKGFSLAEQDITAFTKTLQGVEQMVLFTTQLQKTIDALKKVWYPAPLYAFDRTYVDYDQNKMGLFEYLSFLEKEALSFPGVQTYITASDALKNISLSLKLEENLQFELLPLETKTALTFIEDRLPLPHKEQLTAQTLYYRLGLISSSEYYLFLGDLLAPYIKHEHDNVSTKDQHDNASALLPMENIKNLIEYIHLLNLQKKIRSDLVIKDIHAVSEQLWNELKNTYVPEQETHRKIMLLKNLTHKCTILQRHLNLKFTLQDIQSFQKKNYRFTTQKLITILTIHAQKHNIPIPPDFKDMTFLHTVDHFMSSINDFYSIILKNHDTFALKIIDGIKKENKTRVIIITNPLYADAVLHHLEKENISYIMVSPKVTSLKETTPYFDLLKI